MFEETKQLERSASLIILVTDRVTGKTKAAAIGRKIERARENAIGPESRRKNGTVL